MITIPVLAAALWEARNYGIPVPKSMAQCLNSIDDALSVIIVIGTRGGLI
jgi:H+/gluconate symporter-like permease